MALTTGTQLGPYEILSAIGAGGMGEVYKARDTRLNRTVAIKVLPSHFSDNAEMKSRFDREAQTIAGLNHPHICVLHDVGHQDGTDYLVMEYLEGQTLAQRLEKGALPLDEALKIATEIADALDKAHRQGVIHRDLKPGNVMLTKSGAKLLDFGLAKLKQETQQATTVSALPTNADVTAKGTILGTLQYMAPEQLEGEEADPRTDIFAFGAILYEMVTGKKAFIATSHAGLIGAILKDEPPNLSSNSTAQAPLLTYIVQKCLSKKPADRWQSAQDVMLQLEWQLEQSFTSVVAQNARKKSGILGWLVAAGMAAAAAVVAFYPRSLPPVAPIRFTVTPPDNGSFDRAANIGSLSPDGRFFAFIGNNTDGNSLLWVRSLNSLRAEPLSGTEGATAPFWSPDSRSIAFVAQTQLKRIDASGGPVQPIVAARLNEAGTWGTEGVILFTPSPTDGIYRVSAIGGTPSPVTILDSTRQETSHIRPWFLPDKHHFIFLARSGKKENWAIRAGSIDNKESKIILNNAESTAAYSPEGYLLYMRAGSLMAQRFDTKTLELQAEPMRVADQVSYSATTGYVGISISDTGLLAYRSGALGGLRKITWFTRDGKEVSSVGGAEEILNIDLSPDDQRVAKHTHDPGLNVGNIWIHDLLRGTLARFTFGPGDDSHMVWSPDGQYLAYANNTGNYSLYRKLSSGGGERELILDSNNARTSDWTADGRFIIFEANVGSANRDIWALPTGGDRKPFPVVKTMFDESRAQVSPDGRWIAYVSNESRREQVYVQPFPGLGGDKWSISTAGGTLPKWRRDGKELYYISRDGKLIAVPVKYGNTFEPGVERVLFETRIQPDTAGNQYSVSRDGQKFLVSEAIGDTASPITVVLNWTAALNKN